MATSSKLYQQAQALTPTNLSLNLPDGITKDQKAMIDQIAIGMNGDKLNYQNNLANLTKLGATPAVIYAFKHEMQQNMDAQFAAGPPPGARRASLMAVGLKDPQLSETINYLMQKAGFYPPVDDLGTNFKDALTMWANDPGRTAGEKNFAAEMLNLIKPGMSAVQIKEALNNFLGASGAKNIFQRFGIDPKNFRRYLLCCLVFM